MAPRLTIVVPAYNEAERIGPGPRRAVRLAATRWTRAQYRAARPTSSGEWDVLVVDDGSEDDTVDIVETRPEAQRGPDGSPPRLRVLRRRHAGKGAAVTAGILAAEGDLIVFTDADMATPPDQIPLLTDALVTAMSHSAVASSPMAPTVVPRSRPIGAGSGAVYRLIAGAWVTGDVPDTQCGFKGFRRAAAQDIFGRLKTDGIVFDAEVIYLMRRLGYDYAIVPVMWHDIHGSRMRVRLRLGLSVLWDLFRIPIIHRTTRAVQPAAPSDV